MNGIKSRAVEYIKRGYERYHDGRVEILQTLRYFKYIKVFEFLIARLDENSPKIRQVAKLTLQQLTGEEYGDTRSWQTWLEINRHRPDFGYVPNRCKRNWRFNSFGHCR